jgi:citrate lyase beta subunit
MIRSHLFVPGNKPDLFKKAAASGADVVIVDLEDSVGDKFKDEARQNWLNSKWPEHIKTAVRINEGSHEDIELCLRHKPDFVWIPKVEKVSDVKDYLRWTDIKVIIIIETPLGIHNSVNLVQRVAPAGVVYGLADYCRFTGADIEHSDKIRDWLRIKTVQAASVNNAMAIDCPEFTTYTSLYTNQQVHEAKELGMTSKAAIHPCHIEKINSVFSEKDKDDEEILRLLEENQGNAFSYKGKVRGTPYIRSRE